METSQLHQKLHAIGLSPDQAAVYVYLIQNGQLPANTLAKRLGISRTLMYKIVDDLSARSLVTKDDSFKVTRYRANHPYSLRAIAEAGRQEVDELTRSIESVISPLVSSYNLQSQKPTVHFMEGLEGVATILEDTLTSPETIYMYDDPETLAQVAKDINDQYVRQRLKKKVAKKILMKYSTFAKEIQAANTEPLTEMRLIDLPTPLAFDSVLNIYDKKISTITYRDGTFTSLIMRDPSLYAMQRYIFEALWEKAV